MSMLLSSEHKDTPIQCVSITIQAIHEWEEEDQTLNYETIQAQVCISTMNVLRMRKCIKTYEKL